MKILLQVFALVVVVTLSSTRNIPVYSVNDITGKITPNSHKAFVYVSSQHSNKETFVRKEVYGAFKRMVEEAQTEGIQLTIVSGTRTFDRQVEIWEEKWERFTGLDREKAKEILEYSSMPGTSRHHWGTDIDINSTEVAYFEDGRGAKEYAWLKENADRFGFFQPYIKKGDQRQAGYKEEKWHWSYYPIADQIMRAYSRMISYDDIKGFNGSELAEELHVLDHFVQGVSDQFEPLPIPTIQETASK